MTAYGYARVSTDGQSLTAQIAELKAAGCDRIFQEKVSGARSDRKQLARLTDALATLPAAQRDAFLLHVEGGLSIAEIARVAGAPDETVKSRLRYAYARLRQSLEAAR